MPWKVSEPVTEGIGESALLRLTSPSGRTVELRGPADDLERLADLLGAGEQAVADRVRALDSGRIGYHVVFVGPEGFGSASLQLPAPGLATKPAIQAVTDLLSKDVGGKVTILSWTEIEIPPQIELATAMPPSGALQSA